MNRYIFILLLAISSAAWAQPGWIPTSKEVTPPKPQVLMNDWADMLSKADEVLLEEKLVGENDSTSTQIAILTIDELNGYDISSLAFKIGDAWGIGGPDQDNGVLILVAKNDHKIFIATGKGMEGAVPDVMAKRIIDNIITPNFRSGDFYGGLDEATDAIIHLAAGQFVDELQEDQNPLTAGHVIAIICLILILFAIVSRINRGGRGGYISRRGYFPSPWIWGGSGSGWSGSSGWGGGGGGGGFGGFGGGSFGGGGAGGSW